MKRASFLVLACLATAAACSDNDDPADDAIDDAGDAGPDVADADAGDGDAGPADTINADTQDDTPDPGADGAEVTPPEPLTWRVDPTIAALPALEHPRIGTRPVSAVREGDRVTSYVSNEILLRTGDTAIAEAFAARWGGEIVATDAVPEPPASLGVTLDPAARQPTLFVIRVDTSLADSSTLAAHAERIGLGGQFDFSDDELAALWTVAAAERSEGLATSLNLVFEPALSGVTATEDGPAWSAGTGAWSNDAFDYDAWDRDGVYSRSGLARAWQLLFAHGWDDTISVAILDGGFWVGNDGTVQTAGAGVADFPFQVVQHDFWDEDGNAGGPNPNHCTGGAGCPWHGWHCASVATAEPDNGYGAAGSGGWVSVPWFFRFGFESGSHWTALRTAIEWRADVVSMSYGGSCSAGCLFWTGALYDQVRADADARDVVLVAAAGNDNEQVDDDGTMLPCAFSICVGALEDLTTDRISYSNWGAHVDLFAATNLPASPDPASSGALVGAGGTSASTPLVAGVVAMLKAVDRGLNTSEVEALLRRTARTSSADPRVPRTLDAYAALLDAIGGRLESDSWEPDNSQTNAVAGGAGPVIYLADRTDPDGLDFDWVRYTLGEWSRVEVELDFMPGLSPMTATFYSQEGPTWAWNFARMDEEEGAIWTVSDVPPGEHFVLVGAASATRYDQWIRITETPLPADAFETNETRPSARTLPQGTTHAVTLHTAGDLDYYYFEARTPTAATVNRVDLVASTFPVDVTLSLLSDPTPLVEAAGVQHASWTVEPGHYIVQVASTGTPTRHGIRAGLVWALPSLEDVYQVPPGIPLLEPGDPFEGWLIDERALLGWIRGPDTGWVTELRLQAVGIDGTLLDDTGAVLDAGTRLLDGGDEAFVIPAGAPEQGYVLLLERKDALPEDGAAVPAIPYAVQLLGVH